MTLDSYPTFPCTSMFWSTREFRLNHISSERLLHCNLLSLHGDWWYTNAKQRSVSNTHVASLCCPFLQVCLPPHFLRFVKCARDTAREASEVLSPLGRVSHAKPFNDWAITSRSNGVATISTGSPIVGEGARTSNWIQLFCYSIWHSCLINCLCHETGRHFTPMPQFC